MSAIAFPTTPYNPPDWAELPDFGGLVAARGRGSAHVADAGESELAATLRGDRAAGDGPNYRPRPGLPSLGLLEWLQRFAGAILLMLALLLIVGRGIVNPRRAIGNLVRGAERQAGIA